MRVDRSSNLLEAILSLPTAGRAAADATSMTRFSSSNLSASSPSFHPTNAWDAQLVVQFDGGAANKFCYWIPGQPGVWTVCYEENASVPRVVMEMLDDENSLVHSDVPEIDSPCYQGICVSQQSPFSSIGETNNAYLVQGSVAWTDFYAENASPPRSVMEKLDGSIHADSEMDSPLYEGTGVWADSYEKNASSPRAVREMLGDTNSLDDHDQQSSFSTIGGTNINATSQSQGNAEYEQLIDEILRCVRERNGEPLKDTVDEVLRIVHTRSQIRITGIGGRDLEMCSTIGAGSSINTEHFNTSTSVLNGLKKKFQDLEELVEKNFVQQRENLEALLCGNQQTHIITELALKKHKHEMGCLAKDIGILKHQLGTEGTSASANGTPQRIDARGSNGGPSTEYRY